MYNPQKMITTLCFLFLMACGKDSDTADPVAPEETRTTYTASTDVITNPERGFMRTLIVKSLGTPLSLDAMKTIRTQQISIVLRVFYFDQFKDKPLSNEELQLVAGDLTTIREAGLKAILRFAYTDDMAGTDAPLSVMEQHLDQLKPILDSTADVIAFVQAGFIGAWGEWHSSSNGLANSVSQKQLIDKMLAVVPQNIMLQVRTPLAKQGIFGTADPVTATLAYTSNGRARVGHHNDCFLSNSTDYGTYSNVPVEKAYIRNEANFVPTGGETCPPTDGFDPNCATSRNEMKNLRWTYLNLDYYPATINAWRNSGCYEEFRRNLGYRLQLESSLLPATAASGGNIAVDIAIRNSGYAPVYNAKKATLVLKSASGSFYEVPLTTDIRTCKAEEVLSIKENGSLSGIPAGSYRLYLKLADPSERLKTRSAYSIRLANTDGWVDEYGGINDLKHNLTIQ